MKKPYMPPSLVVFQTASTRMICGSANSPYGIGYGGADIGGEIIPSARPLFFIMGDELGDELDGFE